LQMLPGALLEVHLEHLLHLMQKTGKQWLLF